MMGSIEWIPLILNIVTVPSSLTAIIQSRTGCVKLPQPSDAKRIAQNKQSKEQKKQNNMRRKKEDKYKYLISL
jgi:hypothetical protein